MSILLLLLSAMSAAAAVAVPPAPSAAASKMICKKHVETGSFTKSRKVCRTRAEWTRITEFQRDEAKDNADRNRGTLNGR